MLNFDTFFMSDEYDVCFGVFLSQNNYLFAKSNVSIRV